MFITSVFAATLPPDTTVPLGIMSVLLMCSLSFLWYTAVAYLFSLPHLRRLSHRAHRGIDRCAGMLFIGFGVKLATSH
jgi:threonine/homoserine/homoserine lactone efflux protein